MKPDHPLYIARLAAMAYAYESPDNVASRELAALAARDNFILHNRRKARVRRRKGGIGRWKFLIGAGKRMSDGRRWEDSELSCSAGIINCLAISAVLWAVAGLVIWAVV